MRSLLFATVLGSSTALASPCDTDGHPTGPITAALHDGALGAAHRVCGRTEVGLGLGGVATIDLVNFYGHLAGGANLEGSVMVNDQVEIFGAIQSLRYEAVLMSYSASYLGLGNTQLGAASRWDLGDSGAIGINGKFVLPTAIGLYQNAWPFGLDLGFGGQWRLHEWVTVHHELGMMGTIAATAGNPQPRSGVTTLVGGAFTPVRQFGIVLDLSVSMGLTDVLDYAAVGAGFRFSDTKRFGAELSATLPYAGRNRALASVMLRMTARLDPLD